MTNYFLCVVDRAEGIAVKVAWCQVGSLIHSLISGLHGRSCSVISELVCLLVLMMCPGNATYIAHQVNKFNLQLLTTGPVCGQNGHWQSQLITSTLHYINIAVRTFPHEEQCRLVKVNTQLHTKLDECARQIDHYMHSRLVSACQATVLVAMNQTMTRYKRRTNSGSLILKSLVSLIVC